VAVWPLYVFSDTYADAFALELALDLSKPVLVTADYGFKPVADLATIEFFSPE
jgi:hypothetical protein